ncbi:MAG: ABC transporter ATP-binding protein [Pseudomonadota bacterium]
MAAIALEHVTRRFEALAAVDNVTLRIEDGTLLTLLGPSGCGKTTALRLVAGFDRPDAGQIRIGGIAVNNDPPEARPTAMVFQSYALWPHKTVFANIAFGLRVRRHARAAIADRVDEVLRLVGLEGLGARYPRQLSGGQRQRVALARALAVAPKVLLLDEPLSNLDALLRVRMRSEIRGLQQRLGVTMVYVTHDQEEALSISDQIAVMNSGRIEQIGTPQEIYARPASLFVAGFIGQTSLLSGRATGDAHDGAVEVVLADQRVSATTSDPIRSGETVTLAIKAEAARFSDHLGANCLAGRLGALSYLGAVTRAEVQLGGDRMQVDLPEDGAPQAAATVFVHLPKDKLVAFAGDTKIAQGSP